MSPVPLQTTFLLEWTSHTINRWIFKSAALSSSPSFSVSVLEVECVREGCQSEMLRQLGGSVPEGRGLTVVFKGPRKSLDLLCQSQEEAQHWARGIRKLQGRVENMSQKEKLDQYPNWCSFGITL